MTQPEGFSAHDVTTELRKRVNGGDLMISDLEESEVDGSLTQNIEHEKVRTFIRELVAEEIFENLAKRYGNGYVIYYSTEVPAPASQQAVPTPTNTEQVVLDYVSRKIMAGINPTLKQVQSRMKGIAITTAEIKSIAESNGYHVMPQAGLKESLSIIA